MASCVEVVARTFKDLGIQRMFGLPGGEILEFLEAARKKGIDFILTREEGTAAFMADVTGQIQRKPGVCVATLGPGAVNMTLGVANAYLDRSPLIAITASLALSSEPFATHQNLDLNAVYRPFTKHTITLDGTDTEAKVRDAFEVSISERMGPVHIGIPSDIAKQSDRVLNKYKPVKKANSKRESTDGQNPTRALKKFIELIHAARRPVLILGLDINPLSDTEAVRRLVDQLGVPTFVTPKAKGILSADHPLYYGVCAGVAGDAVIVDMFSRADLLIGVGFEPVESDKLWHKTMKLVSIGPVTIAAGDYKPHAEAVGELKNLLASISKETFGPFEWTKDAERRYRDLLNLTLLPSRRLRNGLSGCEVTRLIRKASPRNTILVTDVGSIKSVSSQCWDAYEPLTFFESNGLSAMGYGFSGAMAAKLLFPERPVVCIIGDGGFAMKVAELETCIRRGIHFVTVVYNDNSLSLIRVSQELRGYSSFGVEYGYVNFAEVSKAFGAWTKRATSLDQLDSAFKEALQLDQPAVIEVPIDPHEYLAHNSSTLAANLATREARISSLSVSVFEA